MRLCVVGSGALGSLLASAMSGPHRDQHRVAMIQGRSTRTVGTTDIVTRSLHDGTQSKVPVEVVAQDASTGKFNMALVATKGCYDAERKTASCVADVLCTDSDAVAITVQNGAGAGPALRDALTTLGRADITVVRAITNQGCYVNEEGGMVESIGRRNLIVEAGQWRHLFGRALETRLAAAGWTVTWAETRDEMDTAVWMKMVTNAAINPITALAKLPNGFVAQHQGLIAGLVRETAMIGRRSGVALPTDEQLVAHVHGVAEDTRRNRSSMLRDIDTGQRTEIDLINGFVVEWAARYGVETPVSSFVTGIIKALTKH